MSPDAWPASATCPRRKGGSLRCPGRRRSGRTSSSTTRRRMIMRANSRLLPAIAAAAALAITAAACGSTQPASTHASAASAGRAEFPATVMAANGAVHLSSRPTAIMSLSPTATEMLYAIGAGSQVKAVDSDSDYPPQAPITKLSAYQPNIEAIVADKPDLVVISNNIDGLEKRLAAFSIPVLDLPAPAGLSRG